MDRSEINAHVTRMAKRAEKAPDEVLRDSFVPVPALLAQLTTSEHQVLFGRRGTGKTHLLRYLEGQVRGDGGLVVYLDLRNVGAAEDMYGAHEGAFAGHATALLVDVVEQVHAQVLDQLLDHRWNDRLTEIATSLDALAEAATQVRVVGEVEVSGEVEATSRSARDASVAFGGRGTAEARWGTTHDDASRRHFRHSERGTAQHHVLLGPLSAAVRALTTAIAPAELWVLVDEWSAVPLDLQPLLADLVRRTLVPVPGVTVKISALHGRSRFADLDAPVHVGLELGADTSATLDLDDFLTFHNDSAATLEFYAALLHRHLLAADHRVGRPAVLPATATVSPNRLVRLVFDDPDAFHHLVIGGEGVPRDVLQVAGLAAANAGSRPITRQDVDAATRSFFLRDKDSRIPRHARPAFTRLVEQCAKEQTRLVPLRTRGEADDDVIQRLYDARVIHRVRQGVHLDPDRPTTLFDVYLVDCGAFIGLRLRGRKEETGLDLGARFADADQIETRGRIFSRLPPRWYAERPRPPSRR